MDKDDEILRALGRIEGRMDTFDKVIDRVRGLELWQWWLKGAWAAPTAAWVYLSRQAAK